MKSFTIYSKSKRYKDTWTRDRVIWYITIFGFFCLIVSIFLFKSKHILILLSSILVIGGIFAFYVNHFFQEEYKGTLSGTLTFFKDKIVIDEATYEISNILSIKLYCNDVKGEYQPSDIRWDYMISNGVKNGIEILLKNGKRRAVFFQITCYGELLDMKEELGIYRDRGILSIDNYRDLLD